MALSSCNFTRALSFPEIPFPFQKSRYADMILRAQIAKLVSRFRKVGPQGFAQSLVAMIFVA
jgi:hypothetical protein